MGGRLPDGSDGALERNWARFSKEKKNTKNKTKKKTTHIQQQYFDT